MKKKCLAVILVLALVLSMYGCGSSDKSKDDKETNNKVEATNAPADTETTDSKEDPSETPEETPDESKDDSSTSGAALPVENSVVFDQDGLKVTTLSLGEDDYGDQVVNMKLENNSDKNVSFMVEDVSVNGFMVSTLFFVEVNAGSSTEDVLTIYTSELEESGIQEIADIELKLYAIDPESYETVSETDIISLTTGSSDSGAQAYDTSGEVVYDENGIKVVAQYLQDDDLYDKVLIFYVENNSDAEVGVTNLDVTLNGITADAALYSLVAKGKKDVAEMSLSDLEASGIGEITEAEFTLSIFNPDTLETIAETEPMALTFE